MRSRRDAHDGMRRAAQCCHCVERGRRMCAFGFCRGPCISAHCEWAAFARSHPSSPPVGGSAQVAKPRPFIPVQAAPVRAVPTEPCPSEPCRSRAAPRPSRTPGPAHPGRARRTPVEPIKPARAARVRAVPVEPHPSVLRPSEAPSRPSGAACRRHSGGPVSRAVACRSDHSKKTISINTHTRVRMVGQGVPNE